MKKFVRATIENLADKYINSIRSKRIEVSALDDYIDELEDKIVELQEVKDKLIKDIDHLKIEEEHAFQKAARFAEWIGFGEDERG